MNRWLRGAFAFLCASRSCLAEASDPIIGSPDRPRKKLMDTQEVIYKMLRQFAGPFAVSEVPRLALATLLLVAGPAQASDQSAPNIRGNWEFAAHSKLHFSEDPLVITPTRITMRNRLEVCSADYRITSVKDGNTYPGGPIDDTGHYTTINFNLENSNCSRDIHYFAIAFASGETDTAHFAEVNGAKAVVDFGSLRRVVLPADAQPFTADEIAIYRDFLLHYPGPADQMIGMQDTTVAFVASLAFGDEPNPPNLNLPPYHGRKLPSEVVSLTDENAVSSTAAVGKSLDPKTRSSFRFTLSEIAFDSKHEKAVFVFAALCGCKGGQGGTLLYELKNGQWELQRPMLNSWMG